MTIIEHMKEQTLHFSIYYINIMSILMCILILFNITYGCYYKDYTEKFTNDANDINDAKTEFQLKLIDSIKSGKIDRDLIAKNIKDKKITKDDIDSIISIVSKHI